MHRLAIFVLTICSVFTFRSRASDIEHSVSPGVGLFERESGSYLEVFEIDDGYRAEFFLSELSTGPNGKPGPERLVGRWETPGWSQLSIDRYFIETNADFLPVDVLEFNPFSSPLGGASIPANGRLNLPPLSRPFTLIVGIHGCEAICAPAKMFFEYSVKVIEAPLDGDFNYDDVVDFADFLILSVNYEEPLLSGTRWEDGDANLDGKVDLADFLILSANFGAVREPQLSAVPEPSASVLFGLALCRLGALRRRRAA